jgi:hypothetical protein
MGQETFDRHQLAGLDHRERRFSRPVEFERAGDGYRALFRYESVRVLTEPHSTQDVALLTLIQILHTQGYRQLRTQVSFRNGVYLGSQELWLEYPDPPQSEPQPTGFMEKLLSWLHPRTAKERS